MKHRKTWKTSSLGRGRREGQIRERESLRSHCSLTYRDTKATVIQGRENNRAVIIKQAELEEREKRDGRREVDKGAK